MKRFHIKILMLLATWIGACSPAEKEIVMPAPLDAGQLKFSVSQNPTHNNTVYLVSETPGTIPFWSFDGGTSTLQQDTVLFPFAGDYVIRYGVSSPGGFVPGDSVTITVSNTDLASITDPEWSYLTNGDAGKDWVLDMSAPIGWYGLDYGKGSGDDWSWHPDYASNSWTLPNQDYGFMHFDLQGAKNYRRSMTDVNAAHTDCSGKFDIDVKNKKVKLFGCEMLFGGSYYPQASNWSDLKILDLTETSMTLGVIRDRSTEGVCYIGFTFKVK